MLTEEELENLNLHAMSENNNFFMFIKEDPQRTSNNVMSADKSNIDESSPRNKGSNSKP